MSRLPNAFRAAFAAAALLSAASPARAETPTSTDQARSSYAALLRMKPMEVMHMIDEGKKGYVSREEFLRFQEQLFQRMDRDHDGKVDAAEWMGKSPATAAK